MADENGAEGAQQQGEDAQEPGAEPDTGATENGAEGAQQQGEDQKDGSGGKVGATVNRHKYERDLAAKDKEIEELRKQIADGAETKEGREKLQRQLDEMKADMAAKETSYKLELAGCRNAKAGKALLEDHGGDIAKLKEAEPWLFEDGKKTGSTGKKPEGSAGDLDDKLDRAFGLKK